MAKKPEQRFSILLHKTPDPAQSHFDVFFEMAERLFSLKLPWKPEPCWSEGFSRAERQPDHRKRYLDYEGEISGNRGQVELWDQGAMRGRVRPGHAFELELFGEKLRGRYLVEPEGEGYRARRLPPERALPWANGMPLLLIL